MAREDGRGRAEANEELMNKYLESGQLSKPRSSGAGRGPNCARDHADAVWVAFKNKGVQRCSLPVIDYLPSPVDIAPVKADRSRSGSQPQRA